jgi:hypothetical protein
MASPAEPTTVAAIKVLVLGHDASTARNFSAALNAAVASQASAGPQAWQFAHRSEAGDIGDTDFCLLLPWDEGQTEAQEPDLSALHAHRALRQSLLNQQQSFQALRGSQTQQLQQALAALAVRDRALMPAGAQTLGRPGWRLACEKCDDPVCEHILLGQLQAERQAKPPSL